MLKIEHLTKTYGEKKAVDDLNLHIAPGEIYGFIGHNGAGKTTTLRSVVGIAQFDRGEILINGKSVKTEPLACKREIAYIPDNPDLYDYMTGIKYLNFIADVFRVSAADRQTRIRKYAGLSALFDLFLGLKTANLTWTNETTPIKQSVGAVFAMLSGFAYTILLCVGFMLLGGWKLGFTGYMALFGGVTLALCALLRLWLRKKGCNRFTSL